MSDSHRINLWHRLYLHHHAPPFAPLDPPLRDVVRANPTSLDGAGRPRNIGVWDVAMYLEKSNRRGESLPSSALLLNLLASRRVRAFFTLPPGLSCYYPNHLAYLELFTPFNAGSSPTHGLHSTSWDRTSTGARRTPAVPVSEIVLACHLSPKFHLLDRQRIEAQREDGYARNQRALLVQPLLPLYIPASASLAARAIKITTFRLIASPHPDLVGIAR
ncbi:hypothetical protein RhiJN_12468 [Ceratobasidium sp. AG-Ba]|nr:hypothetical protein RhiJN_12468 [Ceratobasidium sp. AG-Ba]